MGEKGKLTMLLPAKGCTGTPRGRMSASVAQRTPPQASSPQTRSPSLEVLTCTNPVAAADWILALVSQSS